MASYTGPAAIIRPAGLPTPIFQTPRHRPLSRSLDACSLPGAASAATSWLRRSTLAAGALLGLGGGAASAGNVLPYPDDPLEAHQAVSATPGRGAAQAGGDPCQILTRAPEQWGLIDVIEQALCHNPQTRQAWANARQQASQLGIAESAYLPSFNFSMPISRSKNTAGGGITNGVPVQGSADYRAENTRIAPTLSFNYLLLDFGGRAAKVEGARQALEAANWTHAATLQTVLFTAIQAYYQLFAARASLEAAEATEKSTQKALDAAAYRYQVGSAALGDKLQAQTSHAQAKVNRRTAAGNAQSALGTLAVVMGLKPQASLRFEAPRLSGPVEEREKDVQELIDLAKTSRPDLAAAEAQVKASEAGILSAQSGSLPTLSLVGSYTYFETIGVSTISSWAVGVQVAMPIFTGFANTYQIKSAAEQAEAQAANRDKIEQNIAQEVWRTYYTLAATRENLQNTQELLDSATQAEQVALGRYEEGVGNIVELLNAEANLANARYQYVQAHYNWRIGKAQLAQALGRLDLDDVAAVEGPREQRLAH